MNHVFLDYENVHQIDLSLIGAESVSFTLLVGAKQSKLDTDLVQRMMEHSASVHLVKLKSSGKNALDFVLAYYLGRAALADPAAHFHIIAKDGGYDPLIEHLRERHINVRRHASCADLTFTWPGKAPPPSGPIAIKAVKKKAVKKVAKRSSAKKAAKTKKEDSIEAWMERTVKNFRDHPKALPAKMKTLQTKVGQLIGEPAGGPEVLLVIERMKKAGYLTFDEKGTPKYSI